MTEEITGNDAVNGGTEEGTTAVESLRYPTAEELAADPRLKANVPIMDGGISEEDAIKLGLVEANHNVDLAQRSADSYEAQLALAADEASAINPVHVMDPLTAGLRAGIITLIEAHDNYAVGVNSVYNRHATLGEEDFIRAMHHHDFAFHSQELVKHMKTIQAHIAHLNNFNFPYLDVPAPTVGE